MAGSPRASQIVFAVPDFEPAVGGTTRQVGLQARELLRRGHDVVVVTRAFERDWPRFEVLDGLQVHRIGRPGRGLVSDRHGLLVLAWWLFRRRRAVRVLHTVMWPNAPLAAAAAGLARRTLVVWAISGEVADAMAPHEARRRAVGRLRRAVLARCRHVVLTPGMRDEFVAVAQADGVATVPVPVDLSFFRPPRPEERAEARSALGVADRAFVVVYVGHLVARKGVDRLVDAVVALRAERRDAVLLLVGAARGKMDTERRLRARVAEDGLADVVRFCGAQSDPRPYLWAADAFALASFLEGMPNSIVEAMACALPAVAPPSAAGDQVLTPDTGIVPPSNDVEHMRAALASLADDPERAARLGRAAREAVSAYSVETVIDEYERLFATIQ